MNGKKRLTHRALSREESTPDAAGLMGDLILAAVNEAGRQVDKQVEQMTQGLTAELNLPGGMPKF